MKKIVLSLLFLSFFLYTMPVKAASSCECALDVRGPLCDAGVTEFLGFGEIQLSDILEKIPLGACPAAMMTSFEEVNQSFQITEEQCETFHTDGVIAEHEYAVSCVPSDEQPTIVGVIHTGGTTPDVQKKDTQQNTIHLINPIGGKDGTDQEKVGITDFNVIIGKLIKAALGIVGSLTLVVFMYGGFQWLTSRGNSDQIRAGLDAMLYAAVGIFIIFSSYAILTTIFNGLK